MNSSAKRLYVVVGIVLATIGISYLVRAETEPPQVEMPTWTLRDIPFQLGEWHGETTQLDPKIALATGADTIVDRTYRDDLGHTVLLHTAMFKDPAVGVYHSPLNCYRAAGWTQTGDATEKVEIGNDLTIPVAVTTWERDGDKILVAYWFQLGQHVLYSRADLGVDIRWAMRGQPKWPALLKVMVQAELTDPEASQAAAVSFTHQVAKWLNQPEHRKYLDRWRSGA
jgi:EpsI family protein